jgi:hypothetical protein
VGELVSASVIASLGVDLVAEPVPAPTDWPAAGRSSADGPLHVG